MMSPLLNIRVVRAKSEAGTVRNRTVDFFRAKKKDVMNEPPVNDVSRDFFRFMNHDCSFFRFMNGKKLSGEIL
jgi:hypothetical protein